MEFVVTLPGRSEPLGFAAAAAGAGADYLEIRDELAGEVAFFCKPDSSNRGGGR